MSRPSAIPRNLTSALCQFIFPFSLKQQCDEALIPILIDDGYIPFHLDDVSQQNAYYGESCSVSHQRMERYYLPHTGCVLFPRTDSRDAFRRFSRKLDQSCILKTAQHHIPFRILSADVVLCPFDLGFITIRTELTEPEIDYSTALEFAARFRVLEDVSLKDDITSVEADGKVYEEVEDFVFKVIAGGLLPYLDKSGTEGAYFETLPFFVDERMYVQAFYQFHEEDDISNVELYRGLQMDGVDVEGKPSVSANNMEYIEQYVQDHAYKRWGPDTYYVSNENTFCCLTRAGESKGIMFANQMYGEYYYGLLLSLFQKIALLKLANRYSAVDVERDVVALRRLIRLITKFSSKYYFPELASQSQGKEIFIQLRQVLGIPALYDDVKKTLEDLFKYQDSFQSKGQNDLLMILTLYSVVGGIYGMNQVIEDLKGDVGWSSMLDYSVFEYLALFVVLSGLVVGFGLSLLVFKNWRKARIARKDE
ncbi:hypothetical protein [Paenibacillus mendelii]|uniref:Group-specific protein n=1 Tax=Paenibacillus mendelii TaxID=206163 RepID=A0ABV6JC12_9BACL|nr:hypothetical protein [Paenibacillus mendelii]MCQ6562693.1 CorA family divalent cation transporter [Paenibacillus mendelii]